MLRIEQSITNILCGSVAWPCSESHSQWVTKQCFNASMQGPAGSEMVSAENVGAVDPSIDGTGAG